MANVARVLGAFDKGRRVIRRAGRVTAAIEAIVSRMAGVSYSE